jgi:serine/threonine protein kinase
MASIITGTDTVTKVSSRPCRFKREIKALTHAGEHPFVASLIEHSIEMDTKELFKGVLITRRAVYGDMFEYLKKYGANRNIATYMCKTITILLYYLKETFNLSHRDIKLENIVITGQGVIQLIDWEMSTFSTESRSSCGTLSYMAPEVLGRRRYTTWKTDVWSLAVCVFSMFTGYRPYTEPSERGKDTFDDTYLDTFMTLALVGKWRVYWQKIQCGPVTREFKEFIQCTMCLQRKRSPFSTLVELDFLGNCSFNRVDFLHIIRKCDEKGIRNTPEGILIDIPLDS